MARKFKNKDQISWTSKGPHGSRKVKGHIRSFVKAGIEAKVPANAKFRGQIVDNKHDRYFVEIPRVNLKTGAKMGPEILSPRAVTLEKVAKKV
jgi:hypothetical protein